MCDPLSITALALSAGGAAAQSVGASKAAAARNDALAAERIRQNGFDQQAQAVNETARDRYDGFEGQQEEQATKLGDYFAEQGTGAAPTAPAASMPVSTSSITVQEEGKQRGAARQFTDNQGQALGQLRSFGDLLGTIGRSQARDAGTIGQISGFKQGSAGVLPYELDEAASAGSGYDTFGRILSGLGSVAGMAGGNPFGPGKLTPATAAQSNPARLGTLY